MVKVSKALNTFFPKMIHSAYLVHSFHQIREAIWSEFIKVELISTSKKIILKASSYAKIFKNCT